ncbi:MAG: hypothetical protein AABY32_01630 [Nanoarchaeota archaeon]
MSDDEMSDVKPDSFYVNGNIDDMRTIYLKDLAEIVKKSLNTPIQNVVEDYIYSPFMALFVIVCSETKDYSKNNVVEVARNIIYEDVKNWITE